MRSKVLFVLVAIFGLVLAHSPARAAGDTGFYINPKISYNAHALSGMKVRGPGVNHGLDSGYNSAWGLGLAAGYDFYTRFSAPFRLELEAQYLGEAKESGRTQNLFGGDFSYSQTNKVKGVFINGFFDLHNSTMFVPYAGAGIGTAWVTSKGNVAGMGMPEQTETSFAWNVALGVGAEISYNATLDFGYRYASFGTAKTGLNGAGNSLQSNLGMHQFVLGLRYSF